MVEANCQLARELEVLDLVFANGHMGRVVEKDVGSLEDGVGEETELEGVLVVGGVERRGIRRKRQFAL